MEALISCEKIHSDRNGKPVLRLTLTAAGREAIEEDNMLALPINTALAQLLEYNLANGWEWIHPEEIGALTAAPILSDSACRDDMGEIISIDTLYWFPDYAVINEVEELYSKGFVDFMLAD